MNILFDHQIFSLQKFGGISRYFVELMNGFEKDPELSFELPIFFSHNQHLQSAGFSDPVTCMPGIDFGLKRPIIRYFKSINVKRSRASLQRQDFDVFHPTYYDPYFLEHLKDKPFILTIHDMIPELYPELFSPKDPTIEYKKLLVRRANKIITVSENTKNDLLRFYDVTPDRIRTIYHGCPFVTVENDKSVNPFRLPDRYLLFVGKRKGYKNFLTLMEALRPLLQQDRSLKLVCGGGGTFTRDEFIDFRDQDIQDQLIYYPVNDHALIHLYGNAIAFIYPSISEGFGFPILEAFACGCPVVLSHSSSFPEVAGDAGMYFDPHDVASIRSAIGQVIQENTFRKHLVEKGFRQMKRFSWDRTVSETKALYRSLM